MVIFVHISEDSILTLENGFECTCGSEQTVEHLLFDCPIIGNRRYSLEMHLNKSNITNISLPNKFTFYLKNQYKFFF
jgi:hypothetical protein